MVAEDPLTLGLLEMLCQLESSKLEVVLAPSRRKDRRDHDMIRVAICKPPTWFSKFCGRHQSSRGYRRGFDTKIKRANVLQALRVMSKGKASRSKYAPELRKIAAKIPAGR